MSEIQAEYNPKNENFISPELKERVIIAIKDRIVNEYRKHFQLGIEIFSGIAARKITDSIINTFAEQDKKHSVKNKDEALALAETELKALYKKLGITNSNVLSQIIEAQK